MTHPDIIAQLNALLKCKLTGINQYFLHARMLKHKGNLVLADYEYKASIDAMKYADMVVEHILSCGGMPQLQELDALAIGNTEKSMLENDMAHAETLLLRVQSLLELCAAHKDTATPSLLARIADTQREHVQFIRQQLATAKAA